MRAWATSAAFSRISVTHCAVAVSNDDEPDGDVWVPDDGRLRLVALAAREPGLVMLRGLPLDVGSMRLCAIYTHRLLPCAEDAARGERPEYPRYVELARAQRVPLHTVDTRADAASLAGLDDYRPFDILLSLNWRYQVPAHVLDWPRVAPINLHRGKLPDYAGAEPVRRALQAGERSIVITAHVMTEEIDAGPVLTERAHDVGARRGPKLADDVERIKRELWPRYPQIAVAAIQRVAAPLKTQV